MQTYFLDWQRPPADGACAALFAKARGTPPAMGHLLAVVPTRQAGRRLRECLATEARARGHGLVLPPRVVSPEAFFRPQTPTASRAAAVSILARVLAGIEVQAFPRLFPGAGPERVRDFGWRLHTAGMLQDLRRELGEAGQTLASAARLLAATPDGERWAELARLERLYDEAMAAAGQTDSVGAQLAAAAQPNLPDGITEVLIFAIPDPVALAVTAWEALAQRLPVTVYVQAPEQLRSSFDAWGRPQADYWEHVPLDIQDEAIHLVAKPEDQAGLAADLAAAALAGRQARAIDAVGIGVMDGEIGAHLPGVMERVGIPALNPAQYPAEAHPVAHLVTHCTNLMVTDEYETAGQLLRNPALLAMVERQAGRRCGREVLEGLDALQNAHLPAGYAEIRERGRLRPDGTAPYGAALVTAIGLVDGFLELLRRGREIANAGTVARLAAEALAGNELAAETADQIAQSAAEVQGALDAGWLGDAREGWTLFQQLLRKLHVAGDTEGLQVVLDGWLELSWNEAPLLLLTGFNEGRVPSAIVGHAFLPDTARLATGLTDNRTRLVRDSYLLTALLAQRSRTGSVQIILGKTSADGDALKPSRLLFRCRDERQLATRALRLFARVEHVPETVPLPWRLQPPLQPVPRRLSVSAIEDYLKCPFRFYLGRVLKMNEVTDRKLEMDAMDFGNLCHEVFLELATDKTWRDCTNGEALGRFLCDRADRLVGERFGHRLSAAVLWQAENLKQRLTAAAAEQAAWAAAGWRMAPELAEHKMELPCGEFTISGKIDRVDVHRESGEVMVMDYKTSDRESTPAEGHFRRPVDGVAPALLCPLPATSAKSKSSVRQWQDLQLPLYVRAVRARFAGAPRLRAAYFNLPKSVGGAGIAEFAELSPDVEASAWSCLEAVLQRLSTAPEAMSVEDGTHPFWPPADVGRYDNFERLHGGRAAEVFAPPMPGGAA